MTRAAALKQADIARAIRAAQAAGLAAVVIEYPGGTKVKIPVKPEGEKPRKQVKL